MIDEKTLVEWAELVRKDYIKCFGDYDSDNVVQYIIDGIKEQPKVGEWIPCSERLPEKNGSYLVSYKEAITNCHGICVKYWSCEEQLWRPCNYAPSVYWKAWMPLPAPYKESED
jgi:hypothetical protein